MLIPFAIDPPPEVGTARQQRVWRVRVPANDSVTQSFRQKLKGD